MRWSNGFLRLWTVCAIGWFAATFALTDSESFSALKQPYVKLRIEYPNGRIGHLDGSKSLSELRLQLQQELTEDAKADALKGDTTNADKRMNSIDDDTKLFLNIIKEKNAGHWSLLVHAASLMFGPPTLTLILGFAVTWIVKGFRPAQD